MQQRKTTQLTVSHLKVMKTKREYIGKKQIDFQFENIFFTLLRFHLSVDMVPLDLSHIIYLMYPCGLERGEKNLEGDWANLLSVVFEQTNRFVTAGRGAGA